MTDPVGTRRTLWTAIAIAVIALAARIPQLDHNPFVDEMNHVLAARSWVDDGTLQIVEEGRPYRRGQLFTWMVGASFALAGESLVAARLPALLAGVALVVVLFLWLRLRAGPGSAWAAALLLAFNPDAIFLSQVSRFYSLQSLCLLLAVACVDLATCSETDSRRRGPLLAGSAVALLLALHLQILSAVCVAGLVVWACLVLGPQLWRRIARHRHRGLIVGALAGGAAVAALLVWASGMAEYVWDLFRFAAPTAELQRANFRYYHWRFLADYPSLWTLFPLAAVVALASRRRPALIALTLCTVGFTFHSLAAWKNLRYIFWLLPYFFTIGGIALAVTLSAAYRSAVAMFGAAPAGKLPGVWRVLVAVLLAGAVGFAALSNPAPRMALRMMTTSDDDWGDVKRMRGEPDWAEASSFLREWAEGSDVLVSSSGLKALYFLDRIDLVLNYNMVANRGPDNGDVEFALTGKLARPAISTAASLDRVHGCFETGLVIVERAHLGKTWAVREDAAAWLEANAERLELPAHWRLHLFHWSGGGTASDAEADCEFGFEPAHGATER